MSKAAVGVGVLGVLVAAVVAFPSPSPDLVESCNIRWDFTYANPQNFYRIGDTVRVYIVMGAGSIQGGTHLTVSRVRFELDCAAPGVPCTDDGPLVSYLGNIGGTCPTEWSASSEGGHAPERGRVDRGHPNRDSRWRG